MRNIVDFSAGNFQVSILTEPFVLSPPKDFFAQPESALEKNMGQLLAFYRAAREWDLDFLDFSRFQVLPDGTPRFPWVLQSRRIPTGATDLLPFGNHRRWREWSQGNVRGVTGETWISDASSPFLCRREDFASNLLLGRVPGSAEAKGNARIRIHTRSSWQKTIVRDSLYHALNDEKTLLLHADLNRERLGTFLAAVCGRKKFLEEGADVLVQEFRLFLKRSVFRETILLVDNLAKKEDDLLLRFFLESGEMTGLTVILFGGTIPGECDLELNEDPRNLLSPHLATLFPGPGISQLDAGEDRLLRQFALIEAPVPLAVARLLAGRDDERECPGGATRIAALVKKGHLRESRDRLSLELNRPGRPTGAEVGPVQTRGELLQWLAENCDWAYAHVGHLAAGGRSAELERYLRREAREFSGRIAPGPAADLIRSWLQDAAPKERVLEPFIDILIQANCTRMAADVLSEHGPPGSVFTRLKKAHLALRHKEYRKLGKLLAGLPRVPNDLQDEWRYLNFMVHEKISQKTRADHYAKKIRSPYFRNLVQVQWSDRDIYRGDFARARTRLRNALKFFSAGSHSREEIETRSQMAKLLREQGRFRRAEALYKAIYIQSEAGGLAVHSAFAAVDLGNLYVENDDDFQAECWYQKAWRLFERERNADGLMLVKSNLVNILLAKGDWMEAQKLLHDLLAWDEEKRLLDSSAIDCLNWAGLEALRGNDDKALKLLARAETNFSESGNRKGLGECTFLRDRISCFGESMTVARRKKECFSEDQNAVRRVFERVALSNGAFGNAALGKMLSGIRSRKIRFEALRLLLKKYRNQAWLEHLRKLAWDLSPKIKNYYYFEYWFMHFELGADDPPGAFPGEFLAMHDFFSLNGRRMPEALNLRRRRHEEGERERGLFDDARLVEHFRQWRLPEDFFDSFLREIRRATPVDWLVMSIHEHRNPLFHFSSSSTFRELGDEMLRHTLDTPGNQNLDRTQIQRRFRSPERILYPFAATKMIRWPIGEPFLACLVVSFSDGNLYFQDFYDRHREIFNKFALLFRNFMQNEYRIQGKLDFIVGESRRIKDLKRSIAQVSKVDFSLLITGESGSGKELVANAVHLLGPRAARPFVPVNAAAIP
ncbi:MAG: sigma 54-interacting transcriptional regulator, partial [Candidatus Aminicenantes bacterium]|nr:sigma 54-interacting transcriptional regulator [Candidatus Aminicenantes bacterium]